MGGSDMEAKNSFIRMESIVKIFPPSNVALDNVSVEIEEGKVHSFIGENGAGKSTLMKVLYGLEPATSGEIYIHGEKVNFHSPNDAVAKGIGMVHQEFMLIPSYTVLENVILGYEDTNKIGLLDLSRARNKLQALCDQMGFDVNLDEKIENYSVAIQQKVEIIKQLYRNVSVLILDEPTAVLAPQEADELFKMVEGLKAEGKTILFISHKLDEILQISDNVTVMRQGEHIWTRPNIGLTKTDLAEAMVGRSVLFTVEKDKIEHGKPVLELQNINLKSDKVAGRMLLEDLNLTVHEKEIVGIAGVEGNGQYELVQVVIGNQRPDEGTVSVLGADITKDEIRNRRESISYISQDRKLSGSSQDDSIQDNAFMTHHYLNDSLVTKNKILDKGKIANFTDELIKKYSVVCEGRKAPIKSLSGGNQQKVIVGREFGLNHPLLVLDQPVRGLDVGSIEYIHSRIIEQRDAGAAVLLVSADLDELFSLSDRIVVMYKGKIVAERIPEDTTRNEIGGYMLGSIGDSQ